MIKRSLYQKILSRIEDRRAIILFGARQVGKTTLLRHLLDQLDPEYIWLNGDEPDIRKQLQDASSTFLRSLIGNRTLLVIDEAQRIENIGIIIKLITDQIPGVKVIASGSSSFELANQIKEPLTGRKWEFTLYPLSFQELQAHHGLLEEKRLLKNRLIYGSYPDIVNHPGEEIIRLRELSDSYLYKDILTWEQVQKPAALEKLLQALALQIGSQISVNELSQTTGLDNHTVERYINLLEKAFVLFQLHPLSRNLRNEIKKSRKIYFVDNGIRNAVINQFQPFELRSDKGMLWENYLMSERLKKSKHELSFCNRYFWRNHAQQEIDYVEEKDGRMDAFEFKWNPGAKVRFSKSFTNEYQPDTTKVIHNENYESFLTE